MAHNTWDICKNCGGQYGLHHALTDQCPVGGREAVYPRKQEWGTTTFEQEDTRIADMFAELAALRGREVELVNALKTAVQYLEHPDVQALPFALPVESVAKHIRGLLK